MPSATPESDAPSAMPDAEAPAGGADTPFVTVALGEPYAPRAQGTSTDDYRCFLLETGTPDDRFITGVRFAPGGIRRGAVCPIRLSIRLVIAGVAAPP